MNLHQNSKKRFDIDKRQCTINSDKGNSVIVEKLMVFNFKISTKTQSRVDFSLFLIALFQIIHKKIIGVRKRNLFLLFSIRGFLLQHSFKTTN